MKKETSIIIAENDPGHATLILKNIKRMGYKYRLLHFSNGQEVLDFLYRRGGGLHRNEGVAYVLLLDIRMPKVDGVEVLRQIKQDSELCKIPVFMFTTSEDSIEVEDCHRLGCNAYISKPVPYDDFRDTINKLGLFLRVMKVPKIY